MRFLAPVPIGATVRRRSTVLGVDHKRGRSGDLVFVTVLHELEGTNGESLVREEHDIVYKDPSPSMTAAVEVHAPRASSTETPTAASSVGIAAGTQTSTAASASRAQTSSVALSPSRTFVPTSTTLFRYSALTFNGHRIHYDADYCRDVEGYPNLVVHGPLVATLLANFAEDLGGGRPSAFDYRALAPAFLGDTITLGATINGRQIELVATLEGGRVCMRAEASLA